MPICKNCSKDFEIANEDLEFYDKISPVFEEKKYPIPAPMFCPDCRLQRRISWRNERFLYPRVCAKCQKKIVSVFSEDKPNPVYCHNCWWGDGWDAHQYGRDIDFSRPFFEQLKELMDVVPQLAIENDNGVASINSEYCQDASHLKNCYLVIGTWYTEDSFYSNINSSYNRSVCDCSNVQKSELVYESTDSQSLYNCVFMQNSENCSDCFFGFDLKGCKNCFGCIGLRQKQFYIFNQQYSEDEYKKKIASFQLHSHENLQKMKAEFAQFILKFPRKNMNLRNCENCEGNDLFNCKNTYGFSLMDSEGCKFCGQGDGNTFCYDVYNSGKPNWCYEGITPDLSYMNHFSWFSWKNKYLLYCINCHSSEYLFGCVSLHRAKYSILNKQYTKEEYEKLVPKIIEHMRETEATGRGRAQSASEGGLGLVGPKATATNKSWGEFPSSQFSFFGYNETVAQEYFPLTKEQVLTKGWKWKNEDPKEYLPQNFQIPDSINDSSEAITKEILACEQCGKNYKIITEELRFYKKMMLPVPKKCSTCRHMDRLKRRTPSKLWERKCAKCGDSIKTSYAPDRPETVYCEQCYLKEVY